MSGTSRRFTVTLCLAIVTLSAALPGCAASEGRPAVASHAEPCEGATTAEAYCASHPCISFEEHAAAARKSVAETKAGGGLERFEIGTCGDNHFVRTQVGAGLGVTYYDAKGKLIAMTGTADAPRCNGEFSSSVGSVPKCEEHVTERGDSTE